MTASQVSPAPIGPASDLSECRVDWQHRAHLWRECARRLYRQRNEAQEQLRRINVHLAALAEILERYEQTLVVADEAFQAVAQNEAVSAALDR